MKSAVAAVGILTLLALQGFADDKNKKSEPESKQGKAAKKDKDDKELVTPKRGLPGELTPVEEDRLDLIIDRFIQHDTGRKSDPQALKEMLELGPEAIPAIIDRKSVV